MRSGSPSESAKVYDATLTPATRPPATTRIRRPRRSPRRPASGWHTRSIGLAAATASATPKLPTPSSSSAYTGITASSIPIDRHRANSVTTVRTKGLVRTRSGCIARSKQNASCPDGLLEAARARQRARGTLRGASRGRLGRRHRGGAPWGYSPWSAGGKGGCSSSSPGGPGSCSRCRASFSVSTSGSARGGWASPARGWRRSSCSR